MRSRLPLLASLLLCCPLASLSTASGASSPSRPNIVIFLIDDLGWRDLGCCGSTFYLTPTIDGLAASGMRFTDAYAAGSVCSPTRASLLTGKYPARLHLTHVIGRNPPSQEALQVPDWQQYLPLEEVTFAEALREGGYATAHFGKWHLGSAPYTPERQGFEVATPTDPAQNRADKNVAQLTDAAIAFLRTHAHKPFLAYLCHETVHVPFQADASLIEKHRHRAPATAQNHPVMAAMIETLDQSVARVLATLEELGIRNNTIVIFTSDNGGLRTVREGVHTVTATDNSPARGGKATLYEGGTRVPLIIHWPGVTQPGSTCSTPVISTDLYPTLLDMAGLPARPAQHQDGLSLAPLLRGNGSLHRDTLFWHFPHYHSGVKPGGSLRSGYWKLIESFEDNHLELFNLQDDLGETVNQAGKLPEKAAELRQKLHQWRATVGAQMPVPHSGTLRIVNGDFSDLSGMSAGKDSWKGGLPRGWQGSENPYAVHANRGRTPPVCNPSTLGFLRQNAGVLDKTSDVTLTFDVSEPWQPGAVLNASILDGDLLELAAGTFSAGEQQSLVARGVPAGTSILVAFHAAHSTPGLDNVSLAAQATTSPASPGNPASKDSPKITVASYYFGNYHPGDPRNVNTKGEGWSEWELVKAARPRFPGHHQPNVPLWGYQDESSPQVMEQKIAAAADHGIDAFIFDWYHYNDGPFLERPIDRGFLQARNNDRLKFAFMWANHNWLEIQPYKRGTERKVLYPGVVTPANFDRICDLLIHNYFLHPSYWRIEGRPYFSVYELTKLLEGFGSVTATRHALDRFRAKAVAAGLPGLHLNAVVWGRPILPGETKPADAAQLVKDLGFDSVCSYVWIHHAPLPRLETGYQEVRDAYFRYWNEAARIFPVPYFPNVTMGWDPSPRAHQDDAYGNFGYPFTNTISGNTPERFREALAMAKRRLLSQADGPRILNINCWNEWTEGSYLEPDQRNGMKYLEAVRDVFGTAARTK